MVSNQPPSAAAGGRRRVDGGSGSRRSCHCDDCQGQGSACSLAEEEEAAQRVAIIEAEAAFPSLSDDAESRRLQHEREERQCEAAERKRVEAKAAARLEAARLEHGLVRGQVAD